VATTDTTPPNVVTATISGGTDENGDTSEVVLVATFSDANFDESSYSWTVYPEIYTDWNYERELNVLSLTDASFSEGAKDGVSYFPLNFRDYAGNIMYLTATSDQTSVIVGENFIIIFLNIF
jgi:hypothetical protein